MRKRSVPKTLIENVKLPAAPISPFSDVSAPFDVLVSDGRIEAITPHGSNHASCEHGGVTNIEGAGHHLLPALVDPHVHFRTPGQEYKEDLQSGSLAALAGGYGYVACMPNTQPCLDTPETVQTVIAQCDTLGLPINISMHAAISHGLKGETLTDFGAFANLGLVAVSDDGRGIQNPALMAQALAKAKDAGLTVMAHCEDESISQHAPWHAGTQIKKWETLGQSCEAEYSHVERDIALAQKIGAAYHVCHISCRRSMEAVEKAKQAGAAVSCEVTPHHLLLRHADIPHQDPNFKMNPPLRDAQDVEKMVESLRRGDIDFIATDHAPHTDLEKQKPINCAPFGVVGLETAFPLLYTHLVRKGFLSLEALVELMSYRPATFLKVRAGRILEGEPANLVLVDTARARPVAAKAFYSKGRNTPFEGWSLYGWPQGMFCNGQWHTAASYAKQMGKAST